VTSPATPRTNAGMQMDKWSLGDIDVIRVEELHLPTTTPADWFHDYDHPELEPHLGWLEPRFAEHGLFAGVAPASSRRRSRVRRDPRVPRRYRFG